MQYLLIFLCILLSFFCINQLASPVSNHYFELQLADATFFKIANASSFNEAAEEIDKSLHAADMRQLDQQFVLSCILEKINKKIAFFEDKIKARGDYRQIAEKCGWFILFAAITYGCYYIYTTSQKNIKKITEGLQAMGVKDIKYSYTGSYDSWLFGTAEWTTPDWDWIGATNSSVGDRLKELLTDKIYSDQAILYGIFSSLATLGLGVLSLEKIFYEFKAQPLYNKYTLLKNKIQNIRSITSPLKQNHFCNIAVDQNS
jgi:hypothetical protein